MPDEKPTLEYGSKKSLTPFWVLLVPGISGGVSATVLWFILPHFFPFIENPLWLFITSGTVTGGGIAAVIYIGLDRLRRH